MNFITLVADRVEEIPISSISTTSRQIPRDSGDLSDLDSIKAVGLINPILVKETAEGYDLIAGGRRLLYFQTVLKASTIPAGVTTKDLSKEDLFDLEFHENKGRKAFTFEEEALAYDRIATRIKKKLGEKPKGSHSTEGVSDSDIAKMAGVSAAHLSQSKKIAAVVKAEPDLLKGLKNRSDALTYLSKLGRTIKHEEAAKVIESQRASTPAAIQKKKIIDNYIITDAFEWIRTLPDSSFDLIEFDPPWGIGRSQNLKHKGNLSKVIYDDTDSQGYTEIIKLLAPELFRIAKDRSWIIIWNGLVGNPTGKETRPWCYYQDTYEIFSQAGWKVDPIPATWHKEGHVSIRWDAQTMLSRSCEWFLYARKGNATLNKPGRGDVFPYPIVEYRGNDPILKRIHDAEKPVEMYMDVLATFVGGAKKICSPFVGSGNVLLAAANLGCEAIGCDKDGKYRPTFVVRVNEGEVGEYSSYGD